LRGRSEPAGVPDGRDERSLPPPSPLLDPELPAVFGRSGHSVLVSERLRLHDFEPRIGDVREEVRAGLARPPRRLSSRHLYDERGSRLFEEITRLPEYYPTRTETGILSASVGELHALAGDDATLVEYGSGSSKKTRLLLEVLRPAVYMPIDISWNQLVAVAHRLVREFAELRVEAVCADYGEPIRLPRRRASGRIVGFFPGSSIGNFEPHDAGRFLARARETLGAGSLLLVGVDRKKSPARIEAAYDDADGVTAAFNRNVLLHLRRLLGGDVDPEAFAHRAVYDEDRGRLDMYLVSRRAQTFRLGDQLVRMQAGERLHTESAYKYHPSEFAWLARDHGYDVVRHWTDAEGLFSVFALEAA